MSIKNKNIKQEVVEKESLTKGEKIFYSVIGALGLIAVIIVLIVFIPQGGKKDNVIKQFPYLEEGHLVEEMTFDEFETKLETGEEFQLILGNNTLEDATYYVVYANELIKDYDIEKIYYINTLELSSSEKNYFKQDLGLTNAIFEEMNLIYFDKGLVTSQTYSGDLEEEGNCWDQLVKYFEECYGELE